MNRDWGVAGAIACLTLLTYFQFPGHTYLQQDTQIYIPILEHLWDPSVLSSDLLVERPHVAFTLYDELAIGLRWLTGAGFHPILACLQILTRGLGIWGLYLVAQTMLKDRLQALFVAAICSLGAAIDGPAVLTIEYEPSPRAFAIPLVFLAIGLVAWKRPVWAAVAAAAGFVLHPPSLMAFWLVFFLCERRWRNWVPLAIATLLLLIAAAVQPGVKESQAFFSRVTPELERLQRMRASYNWVSLWWGAQWWKHCFLFAVVLAGYWRIRKLGLYIVGLPLIGMLSVPLSFLLLEKMKWALMPQLQPARTLLFVTAMAILLAGVCGCLAARAGRWLEAFFWFSCVFVPPLVWNWWWLCALLALAAVLAARYEGFRFALAPLAVAYFFVIPVRNYPLLRTPQLEAVSQWARSSTTPNAVFAFPDAGKRLDPGFFRSEGLRAVYVDWKGGGQVNYLPELGELWWARWRDVMLTPSNIERLSGLGIDYIVVQPGHRLLERQPIYENPAYLVYAVAPKAP